MKNLLYALALSTVVISACSDPSSIGASILGSEELTLNFTDQIELKSRTVLGDSLRVTNGIVSGIGVLDEPIFGKIENQLYFSTSIGPSNPDFSDAVLDSIVLAIPYDTLNRSRYGDTTAVHNVELFQIDQNLFTSLEELTIDSIFTTTSFPYDEANLVGQRSFVPKYLVVDSIKGHNTERADSLVGTVPEMRIRVDNSFGTPFFENPENIASDSVYQDLAKGFLLKSTPSTSSYLGLDFSESFRYKLLYYYTKDADNRNIYEFNVAGFTSLNVIQEYDGSGSALEAALNDPTDNQEYAYIESFAGANMEIDLEDIKQFEGKIINAAVIELTVADVPGYDLDLFAPIDNVTAFLINEEGNPVSISDVSNLDGSNLTNLRTGFGGNETVDSGTGIRTYRFNITNHVIELLRGEFGDNYKIYLRNLSRSLSPKRVIFNGNGANGPAPKLNLIVTEP